MLTTRGWCLLFGMAAVLSIGLATRIPLLTLIGLTLLLWFAWEWLLFIVACRRFACSSRVVREVRDDRGPVTALWAGQTFDVRVELTLRTACGSPSRRRRPTAVPFGVEWASTASPQSKDELRRRAAAAHGVPHPLPACRRRPASRA